MTKYIEVPDKFYEDIILAIAHKYEEEDNLLKAIEVLEIALKDNPLSLKIKQKYEELTSYIKHLESRDEYKKIYANAANLMLWFYNKKIYKNPRFIWVSEKLKNLEIKKILDVGCFRGEFSIGLSKLGYSVTGIDISEKNVKIANRIKKQEPVKFLTGFAEDIDKLFSPASFDAVLLFEILEHIKHPEEVLAVAEKILTSNGWIFITVPIQYSEYRYHQILRKDLIVRYFAHLTTYFREHLRKFDDDTIQKMFGHRKCFSREIIKVKNDSWYGITYQI